MKKILYIHGLSSSGASSTALALKKQVGNVAKVIAPDIPIDVYDALATIKQVCNNERPDLIIGSSMGAMLAQLIRGYKKILVNPAFQMSELLQQNIGEQLFFNRRKDGATTFNITEEVCKNYASIEKTQFDNIKPFDIDNTYAFFGTKDEVANCKEEYSKHYKNAFDFEGEHRLTYSNVKNYLTPLISKILDVECIECKDVE